MKPLPKVAIVYLSFHSEPYLSDVVTALKKMTYPKDQVEFVIVDNPHPVHGSSVRYIEETVMPLSGRELPHVTLLPQKENLGFAGGNNAGIQWALDNGFEYVYFHNNDGFTATHFLEPLVDAMEADRTIGAIQSMVMLYPESNLVNTSGNSLHYLAIGFCNDFRVKEDELRYPPLYETSYASGAAMLMRADLLKKFGLWDHDFFLYHEDIEYSYRLRAAGYKIMVARDSVFYHKYNFSRNAEKFYFIERNRFGVMLMFYSWATFLVLLPIMVAFELGILLLAYQQGWLQSKINVYKYWMNPSHWRLWLAKRARVQSFRTVSDKELLATAVSEVHFEEKSVNTPLLKYFGNPLMNMYWKVVKKLIVW